MTGVLMNLRQAAAHLGGGLTTSSLRTEIRKGNLLYTIIANRYLVTEDDLEAMLRKCRVGASQSLPVSTSASGVDAQPTGSCSTEDEKSILDSVSATARLLRNGSLSTLRKSIARPLAKVIPIR